MRIGELAKPGGVWCTHCAPGSGCRIHPIRPGECRSFQCLWLMSADLPDHWKPSVSRMVLVNSENGHDLEAKLDPQRPAAWRTMPYYRDLKTWAQRAVAFQGKVLVSAGRHYHAVLPDQDVDLGVLGAGDQIGYRFHPSGTPLTAYTVRGAP